MRTASSAIVLAAAAACTARGVPLAVRDVAEPSPQPWEVVRSQGLEALDADELHVYWADGGILRRAHGGISPAERLLESDVLIEHLAVGTQDVFFLERGGWLRAVPKAGGEPAELAELDGGWGLIADVDGVWIGAGAHLVRRSRGGRQRVIPLPASGTHLAIAGDDAYVTAAGPDATIIHVDLISGVTSPRSTDPLFAGATGVAVAGSLIVAGLPNGLVTMSREGGAPTHVFPQEVEAVAADAAGYVVSCDEALLSYPQGEPPRVIATSTPGRLVGIGGLITLSTRYAYHAVAVSDGDEWILRGEPRTVGPTLLPVPIDAVVSAIAADGDRAFLGIERAGRHELVELTAVGMDALATAPDSIERIVAGGGELAFDDGGVLYRVEGDSAIARHEPAAPPVALQRGRVYWHEEGDLRAIVLAEDSPAFVVATGDDVREDPGSPIAIADDHLYFVIRSMRMADPSNLIDVSTLVRVDEHQRVEEIWQHPSTELAPSLAVIDGSAYVHDVDRVYRVRLRDGSVETAYDAGEGYVEQVFAVGDHLMAWIQPAESPDAPLLEVPIGGGAPEMLWNHALDHGSPGPFAAGDRAVFVYSRALSAVVRIDVVHQREGR